jgi:hypothetical protein
MEIKLKLRNKMTVEKAVLLKEDAAGIFVTSEAFKGVKRFPWSEVMFYELEKEVFDETIQPPRKDSKKK